MIEPNFHDIGKEVVLQFSYPTKSRGIITHFNDHFVYVRMHGADQPKAFKRRFLAWPKSHYGANRCVGIL